MGRISKTLIIMTAISSTALAADETKKVYGENAEFGKVVPLTQAVSKFEDGKTAKVAVSGTVEKVCKKKGCWMTLKDGSESVRITFKDYGFFVPTSLIGKPARAIGYLERKRLSKAEVAHYLSDAGASADEIRKAKPKTTFSFVASTVEVTGS